MSRGENKYRGDGMLNERRVKLMTRMAMYETKEGYEDFKISAYYQKDYISLNAWITAIWTTIGYVLLTGSVLFIYLDEILDNMNLFSLLMIAGVIAAGYLVVIMIAVIWARNFYKKKYTEARTRVKKFNHDLICLGKMYEKETK